MGYLYYILALFLLLLPRQEVRAQEIPNLLIFAPEDYNAETQNWKIDRDGKGNIYVANNSGLLEYNGVTWSLYEIPNSTIVRSVKVVDNRIYTGFYMGFGYWTRSDTGKLLFTDLSEKAHDFILPDEEFWNIHAYGQSVIFQSLDQILVYNQVTDEITAVQFDGKLEKSVFINNVLYIHTVEGQIYKLQNGAKVWVAGIPLAADDRIENIFPDKDGLLILTKRNGFLKLIDNQLNAWQTDADDFLNQTSVYTSIQLSDGKIALGLVDNGLLVINPQGQITERFSTKNGLSNNTVLSLFEDANKNIWLGLDIGINVINYETPIRKFFDPETKLGTVYAAVVFRDTLYLGTNQGVYFKPNKSNTEFQQIVNTKGQVWSLKVFNNTLFCAHNFGVYTIDGSSARLIFGGYGVWTFVENPIQKDQLLVGTYQGLANIVRNKDGLWVLDKIKGFNISSRNIAADTLGNIWVSHEYKGVYQLKTDSSYRSVEEVPNNFSLRKSKNASVTNFQDHILFADAEGIFSFDYELKLFAKNEFFSELIDPTGFLSGKLINIGNKCLWVFNRDYIASYKTNPLTGALQLQKYNFPQHLRKTMNDYENVAFLPNGYYLIGNTEGYLLIPEEIPSQTNFNFELVSVSLTDKSGKEEMLPLNQPFEVGFGFGNISFVATSHRHNLINPTEFSYRLDTDKPWSNWQTSPIISFGFLDWGEYNLEIRARVGGAVLKTTLSQKFKILRPWYFSNFSIGIYVAVTIFLVYLFNRLHRRYYRKKQHLLLQEKQKQMDEIKQINQQQIIQLKNEQLNLLIEKKNKELEQTTTNLIQKNELLNNLKKEIKRLNHNDNINALLNFIEKNRNENQDWKLFEEAFNNADKDFINKLKSQHPNLTNNDLRLCAYLRLNLSSKEIAPLLNISVRSLEIKRYRLRQKLEIPHETNLSDYILSV